MNAPDSQGTGDVLRADMDLARLVRDAALSTPGVAGIGHGTLSEAATYGLGEKVVGVKVDAGRVEVHVVAAYPSGFPLPDLVARLRQRIEPMVPGRTLNLVIEDLLTEVSRPRGVTT